MNSYLLWTLTRILFKFWILIMYVMNLVSNYQHHLCRWNTWQGWQLHVYWCISLLFCQNFSTTLWSLTQHRVGKGTLHFHHLTSTRSKHPVQCEQQLRVKLKSDISKTIGHILNGNRQLCTHNPSLIFFISNPSCLSLARIVNVRTVHYHSLSISMKNLTDLQFEF